MIGQRCIAGGDRPSVDTDRSARQPPTPTGRVIVEAARGRIPGFVDTGLNLVHVADVASGHLAALVRGKVGAHYILGGDNVLLADMLRHIAILVGRRPPRFRLPRTCSFPSLMGPNGWEPARRRAVHHRRRPRMAGKRMFFDDSRAPRELGYVAALSRGPCRRDRLVSRPTAASR